MMFAMARRSPYSSLPIQRRRSRGPIISTIIVALVALGLVTRMMSSRTQAVADEDELLSSLEKAAAVLQEGKKEEAMPPEKIATKDKASSATAKTIPVEKKAAVTQPSMPEAMGADKVREEFEKAATVLRQYFQSPSDEALAALLRHPDQSMPRHRLFPAAVAPIPAATGVATWPVT